MSRAQILVVDDEPDIRRLVQEILEDENYDVETAEDAASARAAYEQQHPDLVLLDIWMPDTDGISLLKEWSSAGRLNVPVVMMSGHGNVETAVEATRLGAYDFIEKPVSMGKLLVTVERALQTEKLKQENLGLRTNTEPTLLLTGKSPAIQELRQQLERVANSDAWILISGEQGSGKHITARYLHSISARKSGPLIELNLTTLSKDEAAAELFGQYGSGALERAQHSSLALHEITMLDPNTQGKLLQILEHRRLRSQADGKEQDLDVRIIASTSSDLERAVSQGRFLENLYFLLNVIPLHMPSLRERREDVPDLVNAYIDWLVEHEHLPYRKFTIGALNHLRNYAWPGNLRELKTQVQRLLVLNKEVEVQVEEVEQVLSGSYAHADTSLSFYPTGIFDIPLRQARDQFEKAYLEYHLKRTGGNVSELADIAGMERTHLYRKLKQLGVNPKQIKVSDSGKH